MDNSQSPRKHTVKSFDDDLNSINSMLMEMGGLAKKQLQKSLKALKNEDLDLAKKVMVREEQINTLEVEIDAAVARMIALRQPMAGDLRQLMSISKSVVDIERIGDEARKISRMTMKFFDGKDKPPRPELLRDVYTMSKIAIEILNETLDCLGRGDPDKALEIARSGQNLGSAFNDAIRRLATYMLEDSRNIGHAVDVIFIVKALERIGDHAQNIAEYIVYATTGEDIRHLDPTEASVAILGHSLDIDDEDDEDDEA